MTNYINYEALIANSLEWEVPYEFSRREQHTSIRMQGTQYPNSITEPEFNSIRQVIEKHNLKKGYEVGTGFGVSTLAMGLGFEKTGGKIVTIDAYHEEALQDPLQANANIKHEDSRGFKSVQKLVSFHELEKVVFPMVGWSPGDSEACINKVFGEEEKLDFVFIDAFHTEDAVIADFEAIKHRIDRDRCVIAFHDSDIIPNAKAIAEEYLGVKSQYQSEPPWGFYLSFIEKV